MQVLIQRTSSIKVRCTSSLSYLKFSWRLLLSSWYSISTSTFHLNLLSIWIQMPPLHRNRPTMGHQWHSKGKWQGKVNVLVLLDMSAAFDAVDHDILLFPLETDVGVSGIALSWFRPYLSGRSQSVSCDGRACSCRHDTCGVPQGLVLGPLLFCISMRPLEHILQKHDISLCWRHTATPFIRS